MFSSQRLIALPARREQALRDRRECHHRVQRFALFELRRDVQGRQAVANRPEIDVIAAGRLLAVLAAARSQIQQAALRLEQRARPVREPERRGQEDVCRGATLGEVLRELIPARASPPIQHPLRRRRAMVDVARIDVRARIEQHIDDGLRGREMERRLPVAAPLVHAGRVGRNHLLEHVRAIQVRRGTRIHHRAGGNQPLGRLPGRRIERVERARPPLAPPVRIGARLEQHAHHRRVAGVGDDRGRVEREERLVDALTQLRVVPQAAGALRPRRAGRARRGLRCLVKRSPLTWSLLYPGDV